MQTDQTLIVQGNEACVWGAIRAGCRFFAGYPITPASEIAEVMSRELPRHNGLFVQMEDEIASINSLIGAVWGGMKACTATSGPGFSLMQEGIGYAAETETPLVIINVMRGGPSTGQPTLSAQQDVMQARYGSHGDYEVIALCPSSVQEAFELTVRAFNLAETFRVPVIVLSDEIIGHTREKLHLPPTVDVVARRPPRTAAPDYVPYRADAAGLLDGMPVFGQGYRMLVDGQLHDDTGNRAGHDPAVSGALVERLCRKITDHETVLTDVGEAFCEDARHLVVAYGSVARSALSAVQEARRRGIPAGLLTLRTLWPFPDAFLRPRLQACETVVVPEMNIGKIVRELQRLTGDGTRLVPVSRMGGRLHTPKEILAALPAA